MPSAVKSDTEPPAVNENSLEGRVAPFTSTDEARTAIEDAFDYRGDVTIHVKGGELIEGFIFNRSFDGNDIAQWSIELFTKDSPNKKALRVAEIEKIAFSGKDTAHGKSFERWIEKYKAKKAAEAAAREAGQPATA